MNSKHASRTLRPTAGTLARRDALQPMLRLAATALFGAALLAAASASHASDQVWRSDDWQRRPAFDTWAEGRLVDVQLRVDGEAAPLYFAPDRDDRRYFQAFAGRNYSVVLRNNTDRRIAVVMAVDGLNVLNGEITSLTSNEPMYVLDPRESATIRGWRTSMNEVRRFVFVDEQRSYAERTGQANSDMGWIRVVTFNEKRPWFDRQQGWGQGRRNFRDEAPRAGTPVPQSSEERSDLAPQSRAQEAPKDGAPAPSAKSVAPQSEDNMARSEQENGGSFPGTGWGERREDRVRHTTFTPVAVAVDRMVFRYEYASGLQALGIHVGRRQRDRLGERDGEVGFARPPRRW